jgi:3-methylcrotonyl-CoA carboxylase alpha subunit
MFASVLIANRGEIACRIARTAKRLGMRTVAVYSQADAGALHVRMCDEAFPIGPAPARDSYLVIGNLIEVARRSGAQCIHPGYGFLAEKAEFAEACRAAGIQFVGPPAAAIRAMGLKDRAKALMEQAGVPVVPGYHGERQQPKFLKEKAYEIGYPVLIKAVAGGGGKGMRLVDKHAEFDLALESAVREAQSAFDDGRVMIEKYIQTPRHVEFQVFVDSNGHGIHLYERDCSLQRRHQKVLEEAPAPGMSRQLREAMGRAAINAALAVGYVGAGTVEFIADSSRGLRKDAFWFMEMNTRLQVEHPVTEAITGLDLVEWQFRVAAGEKLPWSQTDVPLRGHAVEARLYAEDPERGFLPSTGRLVAFDPPSGEGIRIDSGVETGSEVTPFYDPLLAKVVARAPTREEALDRLLEALTGMVVAGPRTNLAFLAALASSEAFRAGHFDTGFIDRNLSSLGAVGQQIDYAAAARGVAELLIREQQRLAKIGQARTNEISSPWNATDGFQLSGLRQTIIFATVDGNRVAADVTFGPQQGLDGPQVTVEGRGPARDLTVIGKDDTLYVLARGRQSIVRLDDTHAVDPDRGDADGVVVAPMHGKVLMILVQPGEAVRKGQRLAVVEAMKMEHALIAPLDGTVAEVAATPGTHVAEGARIVTIDPGGSEPNSNDPVRAGEI